VNLDVLDKWVRRRQLVTDGTHAGHVCGYAWTPQSPLDSRVQVSIPGGALQWLPAVQARPLGLRYLTHT
jgi:hypothetical protein